MAKEFHKAEKIASEHVYEKKLVTVPNTDTLDISNSMKTIRGRALGQIDHLTELMNTKIPITTPNLP